MRTKVSIKSELKDFITGLKIIDTHEHYMSEKEHLDVDFNFFHLFIPYIQFDLYSAGMPREWLWKAPQNNEEIEQYWKVISPLWKQVKYGSYAKALLVTMKEFWGISDITEQNYKDIGSLLNEGNREGLYKEIIVEKCKIEYILNQRVIGHKAVYSYEEHFMKGHLQISGVYSIPGAVREFICSRGKKATIDDYCEYIKFELEKAKGAGIALVKFDASGFIGTPDREKASSEFDEIKYNDQCLQTDAIHTYLCSSILSCLSKLDIIAAVHTGVWDDIRRKSPTHLYSVVAGHPDVIFDIYHMGIPYVRECGFLGKNYHNAYLNLCWSHIGSPEMTVNALMEWLDFVPVNKVFGFGGDYFFNPQNIWGHLEIARENLAEVFSCKVVKGNMDIDSAKHILKMWMYDNPARVYKL